MKYPILLFGLLLSLALRAGMPPLAVRLYEAKPLQLPELSAIPGNWNSVPVAARFGDSDYPTEMQICAVGDKILLRLTTTGINGELRGSTGERDGDLHCDDAVTVSFDPGVSGLNAFHFTVNCRGRITDSEAWNQTVDLPVRTEVADNSDGWTATLTIPAEFLRTGETGGWLALNCERQVSSPLSRADAAGSDRYIRRYRWRGSRLDRESSDSQIPLFLGPADAALEVRPEGDKLTLLLPNGRDGNILIGDAGGREELPFQFRDGRAEVALPLDRLSNLFRCLILARDANGRRAVAVWYGARAAFPSRAPVGTVLTEADGVRFWSAPTGYKVMPYDLPGPRRDGILRWSCAPREYESATIVVNVPEETDFKVAVSDFVADSGQRLTAENFTPFAAEKVKVSTPTDDYGHPGEWPDPLRPLTDDQPLHCRAKDPQMLCLRARVPSQTEGGIYRGAVTLRASDGRATVIPAELTVYGFELPERTSMRSAYAIWERFPEFMGLNTPEQREQLYRDMIELLAEYRLSAGNLFRYDPVEVDSDGNCDFTRFDRQAKHVFDDLKLNAFNVGYYWKTPEFRFNTPVEQMRPEQKLYQRLIEHWCEQGYLEYAFFYQIDEPGTTIYDWVNTQMRNYRDLAPGVKRLLTVTSAASELDKLVGQVDIWVPILDQYDPEFYRKRQQAGDEVWWYVCLFPRAPYAGNDIDSPGILPRIRFWMAEKYGVQGDLYWAVDCIGPEGPRGGLRNPWESAGSYADGGAIMANGDGLIVYPPNRVISDRPVLEKPYPSLRLEAIRDGIEDDEYFVVLRSERERLKQNPAAAELCRQLDEALHLPDEWIKSLTDFDYDPEQLLQRRDRIARLIEQARRQFPMEEKSK